MTQKELSGDLYALEKQITEQMHVWIESIGIDSEAFAEASFDDAIEDIMTPEQHEIYTGFDWTRISLLHNVIKLDNFRHRNEPVSIFDIDSIHQDLLFLQSRVPADMIEDIVARFNELLRWYSVPFGGLDAVSTKAEEIRRKAMRSWLG